LVDAGLSRKETAARLTAIGESIDAIDAVLVTHEHSDHVGGLVTLARRSKGRSLPVFVTRLTAGSIAWNDFVPKLDCFQAGTSFRVGDIDVDSFTIPHDAIDPVGFCFLAEGVKIGLVTDLGYITENVKARLRGVNLLLLESNHCLEMLRVGPYPWSVKQRVMSRMGHLSNDAASAFIQDDLDSTVETLVLGHISENNNYPALVHQAASEALSKRGLFAPRLVVAETRKHSEVFAF
jgi:phosphoribosyl 1,2-cyclic phosphodiesterase